jgi:parallel beta-helix repeat protein
MRSQQIGSVFAHLRRPALAFLLACLPALLVSHTAADDLCGTTILADLTLDHDLTCAGTALTVGADGITIDLNGHSISGSGSGVGIGVTGRANVTISGGAIENFFTGVLINNSTGTVVEGSGFRGNTDGVDCQAGCVGSTIKENEFLDNRSRGVMLRGFSTENLVQENTFTGNNVSILVNCTNCIVRENTVSASRLAGIRLNEATGNLVVENVITSNPAGIEFTATGGATGNTLLENTIAMNACGLKRPLDGNTFSENTFEGNDADSCV